MSDTKQSIQTNHIEYSMVIILCLVIFIIVSPFIYKTIYNMSKISAETSTQGVIEYVKSLYTNENLKYEVGLPFKIKFTKDSLTAYEKDNEITLNTINEVTLKGKKPISGTVTIDENGNVDIKDLYFGYYKCEKNTNDKINCYK